mmetsp:Transcript_13449/g.19407  ORF Transcript_13449/g.19407 Transcript_13449/m.19407 type:complete len:202 (+) Transcript_13449:80-685(+)
MQLTSAPFLSVTCRLRRGLGTRTAMLPARTTTPPRARGMVAIAARIRVLTGTLRAARTTMSVGIPGTWTVPSMAHLSSATATVTPSELSTPTFATGMVVTAARPVVSMVMCILVVSTDTRAWTLMAATTTLTAKLGSNRGLRMGTVTPWERTTLMRATGTEAIVVSTLVKIPQGSLNVSMTASTTAITTLLLAIPAPTSPR